MSSVREILLSTIKHGTIIVLVGAMALYTGLILWRLFVRLDSARHPLKTYGDIAERIFGKTARHVCTALQSLQLLLNVRHSPLLYASWLINMMHIRLRQFAWAMVKRSLKCPKAGYVYHLIVWDRFFTVMTAMFLRVHRHMDIVGLRFWADSYFEGMNIRLIYGNISLHMILVELWMACKRSRVVRDFDNHHRH